MIARVLLAVVLCGIAAGLVMGVMQHARLTPILQQAETFEKTVDGHSHTNGEVAGHSHDQSATTWAPAEGGERLVFTYLSSALSGAGFAALLAGFAFVSGQSITGDNGWMWGLCGFLAVALAPATGLAPELPGMPSADVTARQIWWVGTIVATAAALWLLAFRKETWAVGLALGLALLPHVIGAPQPSNPASAVPATLAARFAGLSLGANAVMWLIIGILLGRFLPQQEFDKTP